MMISVEIARERVLAGLGPLPGEVVGLGEALGRVLAEDVAARVDHPPMAVSAMDGWAVRSADVQTIPARLEVVGQSAAGHPFAGTVGQGRAVRIFTGAAIPQGADAVVRQEDCEAAGGSVLIKAAVPTGKFIRPTGLDFTRGDVLLKAGTVMGHRQIGLAAGMNLPWLSVRVRPRVAVMSTGDELSMPGELSREAGIIDGNSLAVAALVTENGGVARRLGIARDSRESFLGMVEAASGVDLLVVSGGASVGDYDLVRESLAEAGMVQDFWRIAMRPGRPLMFGRLKGVPVLGLPGNPVAALVCAQLFLAPMIRAMLGLPTWVRTETALLGEALPANDEREDYLRGSLAFQPDGTKVATAFTKQDSAVLSGIAAADCLIIRPPHAPAANAGEAVTILPLK